MSLDTTKLGHLTADLMDRLAEAYEDTDAEVGCVAVVVEVNVNDDGPGWTSVDYRCSDGRSWVQHGLFEAAQRAVGMGRD